MNWTETRNKLLQLASRRDTRRMAELRPAHGPELGGLRSTPPGTQRRPGSQVRIPRIHTEGGTIGRSVRAASLCIASGKGGAGKTVVSASLADLIAARGRTLLLDADFGVGNAHILQDVSPPHTISDVVEGKESLRDILVRCSDRLDLIAAGSGVPRMASLTNYELHLIAAGLEELELDYRYLLVDSAAGVSRQTVSLAAACDVTLVVTTPDLTAMTDAYAFLKVLLARSERRPLLLVNRARDEEQAQEVTQRILGVCERFLGMHPTSVGWLPDDPTVAECVNRRGAFTHLEPNARSSRALRRVVVTILEHLGRQHPAGMGRGLLTEMGYASGLT